MGQHIMNRDTSVQAVNTDLVLHSSIYNVTNCEMIWLAKEIVMMLVTVVVSKKLLVAFVHWPGNFIFFSYTDQTGFAPFVRLFLSFFM